MKYLAEWLLQQWRGTPFKAPAPPIEHFNYDAERVAELILTGDPADVEKIAKRLDSSE